MFCSPDGRARLQFTVPSDSDQPVIATAIRHQKLERYFQFGRIEQRAELRENHTGVWGSDRIPVVHVVNQVVIYKQGEWSPESGWPRTVNRLLEESIWQRSRYGFTEETRTIYPEAIDHEIVLEYCRDENGHMMLQKLLGVHAGEDPKYGVYSFLEPASGDVMLRRRRIRRD